MGYAAAVEQLMALGGELHSSPGQPRRKFDLGHMRALLRALDDPQRKFPSVLVAGTNGKGSTCAMLASILGKAGYRAGLYTSPHLTRINERIQFVNSEGACPVEDHEFARSAGRVQEASERLVMEGTLPWLPSFFETLTAVCMLTFAEAGVDLAVLEVGMGGRLDATNVVEPLLSVITDISLDHTEWLGSTIAEITREKAGILRRRGTMVTLPQHPEANQALGEVAVALEVRGVNAAVFMPGRDPLASRGAAGSTGYSLEVLGETVQIQPALAGQHQQRNAALAIATAVELHESHGYSRITATAIAEGIAGTYWPGRLERVHLAKGADLLFDVAHNPAGAWALRSALSGLDLPDTAPGDPATTLIFGCLEDKAVEEMAAILFPMFDRVLVTRVHSPRAASTDRLAAAARRSGTTYEIYEAPLSALEAAQTMTRDDGLIVVAGSVFLVGELRSRLHD